MSAEPIRADVGGESLGHRRNDRFCRFLAFVVDSGHLSSVWNGLLAADWYLWMAMVVDRGGSSGLRLLENISQSPFDEIQNLLFLSLGGS